MIIVPFNRLHLEHINLIEAQGFMTDIIGIDNYQALLEDSISYTAIADGRVLCCAGFFPITNNICKAWALFSPCARSYMLPITRYANDIMDGLPYARVETAVRRSYFLGHKWMKFLGFVNETPEIGMRSYGFEGETYDLYSRVKDN